MPRDDIVRQLSDIIVDEISLVDRGAGQLSKVLISKRYEEDVTKGSPTAAGMHHDRPMGDEDDKKKKRFANDEEGVVTVTNDDELSKADDEDDDLAALLEAVANRRKRKRIAEIEPESGGEEEQDLMATEDEGDEDLDLASLFGDEEDGEGEEEPEDEEGDMPFEEEGTEEGELGDELPEDAEAEDEPKPMPGDLPEEVSEYVSELERTVDELERRFKEESQGEIGKADARNEEEVDMSDTKEVAKSEDGLTQEEVSFLEELSKSFEAGEVEADEVISKALQEVAKANQRAEEAESIAKNERDLRETREFVSKVADDYPHLPVEAKDLGPVLKAVRAALSDEQFETLEKALAANEAITKSITNGEVAIFSEIGKRGGSRSASADIDVEAQATEMVAKGDAKSHEEAVAKLYAERPDLYDEYLRDNQAQTR